MCRVMEDLHNEVLDIGRTEGRIEGRAEERLLSMLRFAGSLRDKLGFSNRQIRGALGISSEDWALISDKL